MSRSPASALITEKGRRVLLRLQGRFYETTQEKLRSVLGLPPGPHGLGITIDRDRFFFEFSGEDGSIELSAAQLQRRLAKQLRPVQETRLKAT